MAAFLHYIAVGGAALVLHLTVLKTLLLLHAAAPWVASAIGFVIACVFNYTMQRLWVFRSDRSHAAALPRYTAITTVMLGVNTALFEALYRIGLPPLAAQTATTGCVFVLNFLGNRYITFAPPHGWAGGAMTEVAVFDLDGTVIHGDTFLAYLGHALRRRPHRVLHGLGLPLLAARFGLGRAGNDEVKTRLLYAVLGGAHRREVDRLTDSFVASRGARMVKPAAQARIAAHASAGNVLILATASLDIYAARLGSRLGFHHVLATGALWRDDRIALGLAGPNLRGDAKREAVETLIARLGIERPHVVAYSDHHSDLPLLRCADTGIAVDPTPKMARAVVGLGISVEYWIKNQAE